MFFTFMIHRFHFIFIILIYFNVIGKLNRFFSQKKKKVIIITLYFPHTHMRLYIYYIIHIL